MKGDVQDRGLAEGRVEGEHAEGMRERGEPYLPPISFQSLAAYTRE